MTHMLAYLAGDGDTCAVRSAKHSDLRLGVELVDEGHVLVVHVMQTGEVIVSWATIHDLGEREEMYVVGAIRHDLNHRPRFDINPTPTRHQPRE